MNLQTKTTRVEPGTFARDWHAWRAGWEQWVASPHGWLAAVSLDWLEEIPRRYPALPGLWWHDHEAAYVDPQGTTMTIDGETFTTTRRIGTTTTSDDARVSVGDLEVGVTYRETFMIVTYDPEAPLRRDFDGVPAYEPDPAWVVSGRFEPFTSSTSVDLDSVAWRSHTYASPGTVRFDRAGTEHTLAVLTGHGGGLHTLFTDATSGITTYAACRSLDIPAPDENGVVTLDFNRTINLPCAYTENFPICPVPPQENRLAFAIEAGEKTPER